MTTRLEAMKQLTARNARPRPRAPRAVENLTSLLDALIERVDGEHITVRDMLSVAGRRTYGPLLLLIGLFAISPATIVPLMTSITAMITLLISGQMAIGLKRPWMPKAFLDAKISGSAMRGFAEKSRPWAQRIDKFIKPRLRFLANPPFVNLIALFVVAASLITIPLSLIPFAPLVPGLAIVFFGLGITAKDGLLLTLGVLALGAAGWLWIQLL